MFLSAHNLSFQRIADAPAEFRVTGLDKFMKITFYVLLMLMLTPVLLIGFIFYMIPIVLKRGTISGTAYEPFNGRLLYHLLGSRHDPAALQLAGGLPATNRLTMTLIIKPIVWASRITGFTPSIAQYPPSRPIGMNGLIGARCEFLDQAMLDHISAGDQVVILGAGWDTRAYGLLKDKKVAIFEVDAPATQAVKRSAIDATDIDASHVTFVSCDFNLQSWFDGLKENGFSQDKRTFILWEGVTMYLNESAIKDTLKALASLPSGSRIACDFFSREWLEDTLAGKIASLLAKVTYGEPFLFGFPVKPEFSNSLNNYLEQYGLSLERDQPLGDEAADGLPFGGLLLAVKP